MRFRKRINICKGVKLNISKSGLSATVGVKGLSLNLGKGGVFLNTSLPGTGLYDRKKLIGADKLPFGKKKEEKKSAGKQTAARQDVALPSFSLDVEENGEINVINDETGREITAASTLKKIRATDEYKEEFAEAMDKYREEIEAESESFLNISRCTPPLNGDWEDRAEYASPVYMEETIEAWLNELDLPVEFELDFEYNEESQCMMVDLDLPEIEDLPDEKTVQLASGEVKTKAKSQKELKQDYVNCVLGLGVFCASNFFCITPDMERILLSAYTQRRNTKTGDQEDVYIYSVIFERRPFEKGGYQDDDPEAFIGKFKSRMIKLASGDLKKIEPYTAEDIGE